MKHPINRKVRLAGRLARVLYMIFGRSNPLAWAAYHIVEGPGKKLWIHTHGLRRKAGYELEFVSVPADLRDEAIKLMFELAGQARSARVFAPDGDFIVSGSSERAGFSQIGTCRLAQHTDSAHANILRIVDFGQKLVYEFPHRLFAARMATRAERAHEPGPKIGLLKKSLEIFPGEFADDGLGADFDGAHPDYTALQYKSNLCTYLELARTLFDAGRFGEAYEFVLGAVARCPGWARAYRDHMMQHYDSGDPYQRYWHDIDIDMVRQKYRPALGATATAAWKPNQAARFGKRPNNPHLDILNKR